MSDSELHTPAPAARPSESAKSSERPARKKPAKPVASDDDCLAASFFALKRGSIDGAKKALQSMQSQHPDTIQFAITCGGIDEALERLDELAERLEAA